MTSISEHFEFLKAPLNNIRWSWGAVQPDDKIVVLRVWQDKERKFENGRRVIDLRQEYQRDSQGLPEREMHLQRLKEKAICFLVTCEAADLTTVDRNIKDYDEDSLFRGGDLYEIDGDWFIERFERISSRLVRSTSYRGQASNRQVTHK